MENMDAQFNILEIVVSFRQMVGTVKHSSEDCNTKGAMPYIQMLAAINNEKLMNSLGTLLGYSGITY